MRARLHLKQCVLQSRVNSSSFYQAAHIHISTFPLNGIILIQLHNFPSSELFLFLYIIEISRIIDCSVDVEIFRCRE